MKRLIKSILTLVADTFFTLRGLRFPDYIQPRHRIDLLFFGNEQDVARLMKRRLKPQMCVLDVGANVGLITLICAGKVGKDGRVVAFEPDPHTREFLQHNVKSFANVTVSAVALSDENSKAKFHLHPQSGTSNSLVAIEGAKEIVEVECMTMDSFLAANPTLSPNCIKIDVEGAELKVLAGMRQTLERFPGLLVVIEFCPDNLKNGGQTSIDYYSLLEELDFGVEIIEKNGKTTPVSCLTDLLAKLGDKIYCNLLCQRKSTSQHRGLISSNRFK